ncbi:MAG: hypothetical protein K9L98_02450, partial [Candidatus Pacebacteria bacterium]|nr:hypothetical protein [Candidatus Paceibacterota bacterium]MCF7862847.1 hypothetical protein [Candidatus Paceibacterota bacterium]
MSFYKTTRFIFIGVLILSVFFSPMVSFAIYQPGETLDPDCAPGDSDCAVQFTLNSQQGQYYTPIMQFLTMNTPVKHPSNPILAFGESGTCDAVSLVDPTVVKESDGTYKMWYIGYSGSGSSHRTCFATSNDGINWTKSLSNPVMSEGSSGTYDAYLWENRVIKDGSTYKMWYQSADLSGDARFRTSYATSPDGVTWTKYAGNPIFEGGEGKWDQDYAGFRDVIKVGSTYHAWYEARTGSEDFAVGYATSTDGITWTKVSVDEPVLQGDAGEWDDYTIIPNVVRYNDMFLMFYSTHMDNNTGKIGLATSVDGETWTKYAHNPIMDLMDGAESWENTLGTTVTEVIQDSTSSPSFLLYYRGRNSSNNFQTGVVRFDPFATDKNVLINNNSVNPALHVYQSGAGSALFVESGNVGIGTSSPTQQLSLTNAIALVNTTDSTTGVIYKGADRFLHNFAGSGTNGANVFIGKNSGNFTMGGTTNEASYNTALGEATLTNLTTGSYNTGIGNSALNANTTGTGNTALGDETMIANTTGGYNTAVGVGSLYSNTTGDNNIAVGF